MVKLSTQQPLVHRFFSVLAALALAACAVNPSTVTLPSAKPTALPAATAAAGGFSADLADRRLRETAFDQAWNLVNDRFYDPALNGVDWEAARLRYLPQLERVQSDAAFYSLLGRMVAELRDSHTRIYNAREYRNRLDSVMFTFGARLAEVEGEVVVVEVLQDTSAASEGVRVGMIVTAINGEDARERLRRIEADAPRDASPERRQRSVYGRLLGGRGDLVTLEVVDARNGSHTRRFELRRSDREMPVVVSRQIIDGNIGLIAFNRFRSDAAAAFGRAMAYVENTDGLIIDLRGNPGGSIGAMLSIAQTFFPESRHVLTRRMRNSAGTLPDGDNWAQMRMPSPEVRINATTHPYTQPIAVLIDGYSASSSELLATVLREQRNATIVGRPSCGCVVAVRGSGYRLPGGGALYVAESGFVTPQGNRMEGAGIRPDRQVPLKLSDLREGIDRDVLEARAWLARHAHRTAEEN